MLKKTLEVIMILNVMFVSLKTNSAHMHVEPGKL